MAYLALSGRPRIGSTSSPAGSLNSRVRLRSRCAHRYLKGLDDTSAFFQVPLWLHYDTKNT